VNTTRRQISLGFTETRVEEGQHICYIYNDDDERKRTIAKFLESGLLENEKVLYLVDDMTPNEMVEELQRLGLDADASGDQLRIQDASETYCPGGRFETDEILELTEHFYQQAVRQEGRAGARGAGEMSWCLRDRAVDRRELMRYEARLNHLVAHCPYTPCCQYDARRFDGATLLDVLSVHNVMIVRGQLVQNPYYVDPDEFLQQPAMRE